MQYSVHLFVDGLKIKLQQLRYFSAHTQYMYEDRNNDYIQLISLKTVLLNAGVYKQNLTVEAKAINIILSRINKVLSHHLEDLCIPFVHRLKTTDVINQTQDEQRLLRDLQINLAVFHQHSRTTSYSHNFSFVTIKSAFKKLKK